MQSLLIHGQVSEIPSPRSTNSPRNALPEWTDPPARRGAGKQMRPARLSQLARKGLLLFPVLSFDHPQEAEE